MAEESTIERAAREVWEWERISGSFDEALAQFKETSAAGWPDLAEDSPIGYCIRIARAVIRGIREPSEAVIEEGRWALVGDASTADVRKAWTVMVDAILADGRVPDASADQSAAEEQERAAASNWGSLASAITEKPG